MSTQLLAGQPSMATGDRITVQAIQTGSVRVRSNQLQGKGSGTRRLINTFMDSEWSDWLPIYAWLIDHPEGLIVVDTGETARATEPGYFPSWHPYYRRGVQFRVTPEDEIGPQLENRWIHTEDIRWVVLTHLHTDHAGGLHHFPTSEILVHQGAYSEAQGLPGRLRGFPSNRWPTWFKPKLFELEPTPVGPFSQSLPLTQAGDVMIVPTPGHTATHVSIVVRTPERTYFLAGDASYTEQLMITGQVDGVSPDENAARATLEAVRQFSAQESVVYLPSHDPGSAARLEDAQPVNVSSGYMQ